MGYTTEFEGTLRFTSPLTAEQELHLGTILGEDYRDHPEWLKPEGYVGYIQFEINKDKAGIEWAGSEKFYSAENAASVVIMNMQAKFPEFGLEGSLRAQGEEIGDVWDLVIIDNRGVKRCCRSQKI